jgi:uncharacterized protein YbaR (Trm112 family)
MDSKLFDILACPICRGALEWQKEAQELICEVDQLAFPIRDGIPVMLPEEARALEAEESGA